MPEIQRPPVRFALVEATSEPEDDPGLTYCDACTNGRTEGRRFTLSIDEGVACLACPEEGCSGPLIDSDMLQMDPIVVTATVETSGGTFEHPNDVNVWFNVEPVPEQFVP